MRVTMELNPKDWVRITMYRLRAWKYKRITKKGGHFKDSDLRYAAYVFCPCGAGLAYPLGIGGRGYWDCSDILTGRAIQGQYRHTDQLPFAFYEIKSDFQPSANGATTRGKRRSPAPEALMPNYIASVADV